MNDLVGQSLGPYQIIEELGAGGMAKVYKARQPSMNRDVAIKVLPGYFASDPTFFGRFRQEATLIANLEHPRILPVYDFAEQDGIAYIVMRYLTGGTLNDLIQEKPLALNEVARIIGQVAEGLDYAHKHGVIHRDIKPANIMFDDEGDAYIADFGIAKLAEGTAQFTGSGVIGTPAYISPEQGLGSPATPRSDVYSLGVVLYQVVIGEVPYYAETPLAVVIKHINEPLPLPSAVNPNVPQAVEQVIIRALAKEPEQRFASCGEMAQALREAVGVAKGRPVSPDATDLSMPTELMHASTDPMLPRVETAAAPPLTESGETTKAAEAASPSQPIPAQKRRPGWLLPMAIGAILVLLVIVAGLLVLVLSDSPLLSFLDNDDVTRPPAFVEPTPGLQPGPASLPPGQLPQAEGLCPPEDKPILLTDFTTADPAQFEDKGVLVTRDDGSKVLEITGSSDNPVRLGFDANVTDGTLAALAVFPEGQATIALASRVNQPDYYGVVYNSNNELWISRSGERQGTPQQSPVSLFDGQPHRLMLNTIGGRVRFLVDDRVLLEWNDPDPLPGGGFVFEALDGVAVLEAVAICEGGGVPSPQSDQTALFKEDFNSPAFKDQWRWVDEPDGWNLDGERLIVPVLPGTGLIRNPGQNPLDLPALVMDIPNTPAYTVRVDVQVAPDQDFQGAGLVLLTDRLQEPLYSLMRVSCAPESEAGCQGDAVYFQRWGLIGDAQAPELMQVGGAGDLPADAPISLMLHVAAERNEIGAWYSLDGQSWNMIGGGPLVGLRIGPVGVVTSTGGQSTGETIQAYFDNFVITAGEPVFP